MITRTWHGMTKKKDAGVYLDYIRQSGSKDYSIRLLIITPLFANPDRCKNLKITPASDVRIYFTQGV